MSEKEPKFGDGHAAAMFRMGLAELRAAMYPESNVAQQPEYGTFGTPVPGEIMEARRADEREGEQEPKSALAERLERMSRDDAGREQEAPQREPPEPERE